VLDSHKVSMYSVRWMLTKKIALQPKYHRGMKKVALWKRGEEVYWVGDETPSRRVKTETGR